MINADQPKELLTSVMATELDVPNGFEWKVPVIFTAFGRKKPASLKNQSIVDVAMRDNSHSRASESL